ncbi:MAG TPA: tetratricopeptide repeat protein [Gemmatimonadales bacterium]|nr:tetratricopeptide repeat protein [Gemmatimonadales bacterium]
MQSVSHAFVRAAVALALWGGISSRVAAQDGPATLDPVTSAVIGHPITTSSAVARTHFLAGQRELDLARFIDANEHFKAAVGADSTFALGYLNVANTANSLEEFKRNLALAERYAAGASEAERLQIQMARKGFDNDLSGQVALGKQLVETYSDSPRAWLALAGAQIGLNQNEAARASIAKALELAPRMYVAHTTLGLSYVFGEPRDFDKALQHMEVAESLAPDEPATHINLGDVYRAQRNLTKARDEYTRGLELSPHNTVLHVKRGHANTFLGDYAAARADYEAAMADGRANEKAAYAPFHAFVSIYAGQPAAAIDELNRLVASVDGIGVPDPKAAKVAALTSVVTIATHTRNRAAAEQALKQLTPLLRQQADEAGNPAFRRGQEATIAYFEGWWAARRGDYRAAQQQAARITQLLAPDSNPRKLEPMHQLEGFIALYQGKYREAVGHFQYGNLLDPYVKYQLAVATEGAGDAAKAKQLFREVAEYNFNTLGFALVRTDAQRKVAGTP